MSVKDTNENFIASIVASFAARPDATPDQIVDLVRKLRSEVGGVTPEAATQAQDPVQDAAPAPTAKPAIPPERAVTRDKVYCLCCGKGFKMLKRHLGAEHGMTEAEYRAAFGLPEDMPLVAPSYSERKANYARKVGFGRYSRETARQGDETVD